MAEPSVMWVAELVFTPGAKEGGQVVLRHRQRSAVAKAMGHHLRLYALRPHIKAKGAHALFLAAGEMFAASSTTTSDMGVVLTILGVTYRLRKEEGEGT